MFIKLLTINNFRCFGKQKSRPSAASNANSARLPMANAQPPSQL
jgi:hypothetical protein